MIMNIQTKEVNNTPAPSLQFLDACRNNNLEEVKVLYEKYTIDVNIKTENGRWFGLMYAYHYRNIQLLEFLILIKQLNINMTDDVGDTVLMLSFRQKVNSITMLFMKHINLEGNVLNEYHKNMIFILSAGNGNIQIFDTLRKGLIQKKCEHSHFCTDFLKCKYQNKQY